MPRFTALLITLLAFSASSSNLHAEETGEGKGERVDVFGAGTLEVPADFKRTAPANRIIDHEFQATAGKGDEAKTARVTMMAAGGDIEANISRWKGQFSGADKGDKTETMKLGQWQVYLVDVNGTYGESMGGGPFAPGRVVQRQGYAMTGAILVDPDSRKYFVKMIGPEEVIKKNRKSFVSMIKSIEQ